MREGPGVSYPEKHGAGGELKSSRDKQLHLSRELERINFDSQ